MTPDQTPRPIHPTLVVSPRKIRNALLAILACLVALDFLLVFFEFGLGTPVPDPIVRRFDSNAEWSLPTLYNVELLFMAALVCVLSTVTAPPRRWVWLLLGGVFAFLAIDEALAIHEGVAPRVRALLHTSGVFYNGWVIPYGLACVVLLVVIQRWLRALPKETLRGFLIAAAIYLTGAMLLDAITGAYSTAFGLAPELFHALVTGVEECLEMLGVILFIYYALRFTAARSPGIELQLVDDEG